MFANRLRKNLRKLKPWVEQHHIDAYRLYDADMPEYAVAIDLYKGRPHIAEYAPPKQVDPDSANRRFDEVVAGVCAVLNINDSTEIAVKRRQRQRGSAQYEKVAQRGERFEVSEGPARALVNLYDYLDTGLFLDHRPLRLRIGAEARGRHFLNLFCYTGMASIHAALGGAHTSTSVDLSNTYLRWFRDNLALNGLSERQHRAERADVLTWLQSCQRTFDLILLDPPSFSNSKSVDASFDVQRDHVSLVEQALRVLSPSGTLYFSNNRRGFTLDARIVERYRVTDISAETIPVDFGRRGDIHQCWVIQHR
jgi:23S rRNA (guanine2445-N2)-methyltransferase / 23S rRNA (guanine2069-N7)-methyltransferase